MPLRASFIFCLLILLSCSEVDDTISFNSDIRPILNNNCLGCHGGVKKSGEISFLFEEEAFKPGKSGNLAIIKGDPEGSELIKRIKHHDPDERMPSEKAPLTDEEIDLLTRWIDEGAKWETHWAYIPPINPKAPKGFASWSNHPIDKFVSDKWLEMGLKPNDPADRRTLLRRVSIDLTGLPPEAGIIDRFLNSTEKNWYDQYIDEVLTSSRYGENWTAMWLDLARYADTKGYEADRKRSIWKYRDWLIKSFNNDLPFDQFTIHQIAGDLLENPDESQLIATAFHRNTMNNDEGGTDNEEFRIAAVIDRINTTWEVWNGTSFGCVQCHSHPYDPIVHEEFYQFMDIFNQTSDADLPSEFPTMKVYQEEDKKKIDSLEQYIATVKDRSKKLELIKQKDSIPMYTVPIMTELDDSSKRVTSVFIRGNFLDKGDTVSSKIPNSFNLGQNQITNRLEFAEWMVSDNNPLIARVFVNRIWYQIFGRGIVETVEDFGSQGASPTHQDLLDHLSITFKDDLQWSIKKLLKYILSSETYKQSSVVTQNHLDKDAKNYYFSRFPRVRLSAEQIRDQALFVSDLLSPDLYGPSVMPHQPDGVWESVYNSDAWDESSGSDKYKRGIYTFWKRTSPYPSMITFDSPSREYCVSRRISTNTPLQALVTLNDPVYLDAARSLATYMKDKSSDLPGQLNEGILKVLNREATEQEVSILSNLYNEATDKLEEDTVLNPLEVVANAILNLDEFMMKT